MRNRNSESDQIVDRRTYLKGVAGVGATIAASMGVAASDGDYDEVVVDAHDSVTYRVGSGETLENLLIDISAPHAKFYIRATGSDWTVRNVGIKGTWDDDTKEEPFIVSVNSGGTGRVENFYWADGTAPFDEQTTYGGAATGCYVSNSHAGTLIMENLNLQGFSDNAVYGSSPGDLPSHSSGRGGQGEVIIRDSYAADCAPAGFRLGSDGSYLENCVVTDCTRNYWGFYHDTEVIDCDLSASTQFGDIVVSDGHWQHDATVTATNTYFESTGSHSSGAQIIGESADRTPRTEPDEVEGVPLTPEEAAAGSSSGGGSPPSDGNDGSDDKDEADDDIDADEHLLAFVTEPDARYAEYEFTADGPVEMTVAPYESPSGNEISSNSSNVTVEKADDVWHTEGLSGGGFGDAFLVDGPITEIDIEQPDVMWVELDGEEMTVEEIIEETSEGGEDDDDDDVEENLLAFVTEPDARYAEYEFTADGPVEMTVAPYESPSGNEISSNSSNVTVEKADDVWHTEGLSGGGFGDAFLVDGPIKEIDIDQPDVMWAELNGEEMTVEEIIEKTAEDADDEDETGDGPSNAIVIDATGTDDSAAYSFEVSGEVEKSTHRDSSIEDSDIIDGNKVEGSVDDSRDAYWFSGDIVDFHLNGNAYVDVEYDAR
ncbi:hypothetical protein RBH26_19260 [Natronolimnohabitans sp. A-GB9]|uniref:hypothetical protein n=1 Tax=Natronolimnohabitans sp. A-GB9 TaxID=3069757 RepID=UPI0027B16323|nr:hypothetical protein [Natronolimnohabitans sp. A-GB9]MDQ2052602.1 hypothetical protein [Natronolimnohabitans sp. A-GB9]